MIELSLCAIVKNEAQRLPRFLSQHAPHVDEVIIVDTGSTDGSQEIATRNGARLHSFPLKGNLADARNSGLALASFAPTF